MRRPDQVRVLMGAALAVIALGVSSAQNFGTSKEKVTLMRKLPALVHLSGPSIGVKVSGATADVQRDLQSLLEAELLKDDPQLRVEESNPSAWMICHITDFAHPQPTVTNRPNLAAGRNGPKETPFMRVTGSLTVAFQVKSANGQTITSDNVSVHYDREFDSSGNTASEGLKGNVVSAWKRVTGGAGSEELNPPTDAELRSHLELQAVRLIAQHVVNTSETVEVYLAKQRGALDEGNKQAVAGLWERALETFETATPSPRPAEDAYRLYNTGVAYEALAYKAEDPKAAMKDLEEAAINYGKAIDAKPGERYFLEPQRRIEEAIAHYRRLEEPKQAAVSEKPSTAANATTSAAKALTNSQVIAMVKAGMDDDIVAQAIRAAKATNFDLTPAGQQALTGGGVSGPVIAAMKSRAPKPATLATTTHSAAAHGTSASSSHK